MNTHALYIIAIVALIGINIYQGYDRNESSVTIRELKNERKQLRDQVTTQEHLNDLLEGQIKARNIEIEQEKERAEMFKKSAKDHLVKRENVRPEVMLLNEDEMLKGFAEVDSIIHR